MPLPELMEGKRMTQRFRANREAKSPGGAGGGFYKGYRVRVTPKSKIEIPKNQTITLEEYRKQEAESADSQPGKSD